MQTGAWWLLFFIAQFALDHQGKSTGPNDDHKRNAHKEIFHFTSLRVTTVTPEWLYYTWYSELTPGKTTLNVLYFTVGIIPEFWAKLLETALMYA